MLGVVRQARAEDVAVLAEVEDAGDRRFQELFHPDSWWPATAGEERAVRPGFVLVAVEGADEAVGFVHVLESSGFAHLEQLSVLPSRGRQGYGCALVRAALDEAAARGYREVTLRTYAAVPWNAPFYATLGFAVTEPETDFHRALRDAESAAGLDRYGARVQMTVRVAPEAVAFRAGVTSTA